MYYLVTCSMDVPCLQHHKCSPPLDRCDTVGFHNFNLRIFNLRVSNPKEIFVDVFWHDVGFQCARVSAKKNTMKFRKSTVVLKRRLDSLYLLISTRMSQIHSELQHPLRKLQLLHRLIQSDRHTTCVCVVLIMESVMTKRRSNNAECLARNAPVSWQNYIAMTVTKPTYRFVVQRHS